MENNINDPSRLSLEIAARALVGDQGVNIIAELARLLDQAEKRGYENGLKDGSWIDWPKEEDLRDPIINAHVEGAPFTDMSELHVQADNRSPMSDAEAYEALDRLYDDVDPEARD